MDAPSTADNVVHLVDRREQAAGVTPEEILNMALRELASGEVKATKAIVLLLDDSAPGSYLLRFRNAGLATSEILAIAARLQHIVNRMMDED